VARGKEIALAKLLESSRATMRGAPFWKVGQRVSISAIRAGQRRESSLFQHPPTRPKLPSLAVCIYSFTSSYPADRMPRTKPVFEKVQPEEVLEEESKPTKSKKGNGKSTKGTSKTKKKQPQAPSEAAKQKARAAWDVYFVSPQPLVQSVPWS
jgi:hypothetical protein